MLNIPLTKPSLNGHAYQTRDTYTPGVRDGGGAETELAVRVGDRGHDLGEGVDVDGAAEEAFPEDEGEEGVD